MRNGGGGYTQPAMSKRTRSTLAHRRKIRASFRTLESHPKPPTVTDDSMADAHSSLRSRRSEPETTNRPTNPSHRDPSRILESRSQVSHRLPFHSALIPCGCRDSGPMGDLGGLRGTSSLSSVLSRRIELKRSLPSLPIRGNPCKE